MAGARIDIEYVGADRVSEALRRLADAGTNLRDPLGEIGEELITLHEDRWREERAPDGTSWAPLSEEYAARKGRARPRGEILVFDDILRGSLRYEVVGDELRFGTDRPYGARHQFGFEGPDSLGRNITTPARPWLGLSDGDEDVIIDIIRDYLAEQIRRI